MKGVANFIITFVILWIAAYFFPNVVHVDSIRTLIIATLLLFLAEAVVVIILFIATIFSIMMLDWYAIIGTIIGIFFAEILALSLLSAWIPGFYIVGFWPKMLLALAFSIFRIPSNQSND